MLNKSSGEEIKAQLGTETIKVHCIPPQFTLFTCKLQEGLSNKYMFSLRGCFHTHHPEGSPAEQQVAGRSLTS